MSRTKKIKIKKEKNWIKQRKMKPYCLTGDKRNAVDFSKSGASYEDFNNIGDAKKEREDKKIMRKTEKHQARQQSKQKIKKDLED
jgi:hypothetical protein